MKKKKDTENMISPTNNENKSRPQPLKVVFAGAGNVATHLAVALQAAGHAVVQIYSRTQASAQTLADRLPAAWTTDPEMLAEDADLYVFCLNDDALATTIEQIKPNGALWIHTAGSIPMDIFGNRVERRGVLYPLQTFSRERAVDFGRIPCFIEAHRPDDEALLCRIAGQISSDVQVITSERRKYIHLAAVYASNFTNRMYTIAAQILEHQHIPWKVLLPLIDETAAKIHTLTPTLAQTGPALRGDRRVLEAQAGLLEDPDLKEIYQLISKHIYKEPLHEQHQL
jgi:predicted short-subunit dehydrogenase-like oxidoreductase (DUF2520 family)